MKRSWRWPLAGFLLGGLVGATFLTVNVVGASSPNVPSVRGAASFGEILHTPLLLARAGEPVELSFGVVCRVVADEPRRACSPHGSVFVRGGGEATFRKLPLQEEPDGLLSAVVPGTDTRDGFDYYAAIDDGRGVSAALPEAAGAAPQHVWPLESWTTIDVGRARFGEARQPSSVLARFGWGRSDAAIGLDSGREQSRIGPSAFDPAPDGSVVVLDQVNHRLVRLRPGRRASHIPIDFAGGEGDLAVGADGSIYVLEVSGKPVLRAFTRAGAPIAAAPLAEPVADMVRAGPAGPLVHAYPSEMWLPTGRGRPPLARADQLRAAEPARSVDGGEGVVVHASAGEVKLALVRGDRVVRAWILRGPTSFGEVQLAEPYRDGLLAVVRLWDEKHAVFRVLRLGPEGLVSSFSVSPAEWAETASLSRFRLRGDTLYQMRSDRSGVEIATYEIGGTR
jgi:hypothetical protein